MNVHRTLAAFFIAPATPVLLFVIPGLLMGGSGLMVIVVMTGLVTYGHAVILGAPTAWLLSRRNLLTVWRVVGAAFLVGAIPFAAYTIYQEATITPGAGYSSNGVVMRVDGRLTNAGLISAIIGVVQCGLLGAATGFVWWLIAKPRRRLPHDG